MVCIYCGAKTKITNSRSQAKAVRTWRRHACNQCRAIITTFEDVDMGQSHRVMKRAGILEAFSEAKLFVSVFRSLDHRKSAPDDARVLTRTVMDQLLAQKQALIESKTISTVVATILKRFDSAAAVRYQSFQGPLSGKRDIGRALR